MRRVALVVLAMLLLLLSVSSPARSDCGEDCKEIISNASVKMARLVSCAVAVIVSEIGGDVEGCANPH